MKTIAGLFCILVLLAFCCTYAISIPSCGMASLQASSFTESYLMSPNYPSDYPTSISCIWNITASQGHVVELSFFDFVMDGSLGSDTLEIYDGQEMLDSKILGKYYSRYVPANVYSSDRYLTLRFTSDATGVQRGFKLKYKSVLPAPDPSICSPFNNFSTNNAIQITEFSGTIQSPLYGSKYPSNIQCTWVITSPDNEALHFRFLDFNVDTKINGECLETRDYVEIQLDGYLFDPIRLCGSNIDFGAESGKIWIRFKSNSDNYYAYSKAGFKAQFNPASDEIDALFIIIVCIAVLLVGGVCCCIIISCICLFKKNRRTQGQVIRAHQPQSADDQNPTEMTPQNLTQGGSVLPTSALPPNSYPIQPYPFSYQQPSAGHPTAPHDSNQPPPFGLLPPLATYSQPTPSVPPPSYPG